MSTLDNLGTPVPTSQQEALLAIANPWRNLIFFAEAVVDPLQAYIQSHGGVAGFLSTLSAEQEAEVRLWWPVIQGIGTVKGKSVPDLPAP